MGEAQKEGDGARPDSRLAVTTAEEWRQSQANFFKLVDASPDALVIHRQQKIIYVNAHALALFGYASLAEVHGRSLFEFVSSAYRALVADRVFQTYYRGVTTAEVEERLLHRSGREIPAEVVSLPVMFDGETATLVHIRDISERKKLELWLRTEDRLASVGLMAAGIAHEINNPLTYALCNAELLVQRVDAMPPSAATAELRGLLGYVQEGLGRAADVTREVTLFSRPEHDRAGPIDIHRVLDSCVALAGVELRGRAQLVKSYGAVPPVLGSPRRMGQVFLNLLINAAQAIPPGNEAKNRVTLATSMAGADSVVVEVRDSGAGIAPELLEHVFEPLFTTKPAGSGLGLAISRALVVEDGGTMTVTSEVGRGTCFRVVLRASAAVAEPRREPRRALAHATGKRILIVDDEPLLAKVLALVLDTHAITVAASGNEALDHLRAGERYDLILCDLSMSDMDGVAFYGLLRASWPGLESRVIFMSGDFAPRTSGFFRSISNRVLEKPFEGQQLLAVIDSVLASLPKGA